MEPVVELQHANAEIGRVDDEHSPVVELGIIGAVVALHLVVEGLCRQLSMQFTGLTVQTRAVVVVDAVGDVTGLLDLGQQDAATDSMDTTSRQVEDRRYSSASICCLKPA